MSYNSSDWFIRLLINISLMVAAEAKGEKEKNKINLYACDSHMFGGYPVETLVSTSLYPVETLVSTSLYEISNSSQCICKRTLTLDSNR